MLYKISAFKKVVFCFLIPILVFAPVGWIKNNVIADRFCRLMLDPPIYLEFRNISTIAQSQANELSYSLFLPLIHKTYNSSITYYVSTSGDDSNPGTFEKPWRTIGKAAESAFPGMTVYIRGGIYNEAVYVERSGTPTQPIRFMAYPGENPIIDGYYQLPGDWVGLFSISGDWVEVSGIETRYSKYDGFGLYGDHDTADHVATHDNWLGGILIKADYGTIQNSQAWRNYLSNEDGTYGGYGTSIIAEDDVKDNDDIADYAVIRNNQVWGNFGEGIATYLANGTRIEGNTVFDNWGANIYVSDATNVLVQGNFVYATGAMTVTGGSQVGIMMGDEQYTPPSSNITVLNNIVYGTRRNFFWWQGVQGGGMNDVLIANNIFVNSRYESGVTIGAGSHQNVRFYNNLTRQDNSLPVILDEGDSPEIHYSHNLWSKEPPSSYPTEHPGDIIANPLLSETGGDPYSPMWFSLTASSPAVGQALSLTEVLVDFFGKTRGTPPDIGAVEYGTPTP